MFETLTELLSARAPNDILLVDRDHAVSVGELLTESRKVARGLAGLSIARGDRVALWLPNVSAWLACLLACASLGVIAVAVNTRFRSSELEDILERSGARVLIFWPAYKGIDFRHILESIPRSKLRVLSTIVVYGECEAANLSEIAGCRTIAYACLSSGPELSCPESRAEDGLIIFTTSGTTRAPKFVLHSQRSIATHAQYVARAFEFDAPDASILLTLPLCGTFGLTNALGALAAGRPLIMMPSFDAQAAAALIQRYAVTHFPAAGDIVAQLLAITELSHPYPSVKLIIGARVGQAALAAVRGLRLVGVYGSSEVQAMVSCQHADSTPEERELGGGILIALDAEVRVRDLETGKLLPYGASGELEFRMPSQMMGYFLDRTATKAVLTDDGFVRSGDLGFTMEGRRFVFQSRIGDAMRLSGFLVNPLEIEGVINEHDAVQASQVVAVGGQRGDYVVAFVIARAGCAISEDTIIGHCKQRMATFKVPKRVFSIDAFPIALSANGPKVQKTKLREKAYEVLNADHCQLGLRLRSAIIALWICGCCATATRGELA